MRVEMAIRWRGLITIAPASTLEAHSKEMVGPVGLEPLCGIQSNQMEQDKMVRTHQKSSILGARYGLYPTGQLIFIIPHECGV